MTILSRDEERTMRVAVVGSGMAGLVTTFLLNHDPHQRYAVKLFESVSQCQPWEMQYPTNIKAVGKFALS